MKKVKIQLLDKDGEVQYGLNWGQREKRDHNQAYLQLTPDIYKTDFFPAKGKFFIAKTDDNEVLIFSRAQKDLGTALQTPENNAIIGLYLRKRLGVASEAEITKDDIISYGRSDIDFEKIDDIHYKMDFGFGKPQPTLLPLSIPLQQIYYGAPGTGKSHVIKELTKDKKVIRTTFHPDSDYSTFVGTYKPTTKEITLRDLSGHIVMENGMPVTDEKIVYEFVPQAFLKAYINAWTAFANSAPNEEPEQHFLVIEEINRGNCAQIFGDLFQLLDRNEHGFSDYPIVADNDLKKQLAKAFADLNIDNADALNQMYDGDDIIEQVLTGDVLLLPRNLFIWATMNTSDQSLFPIDSAFKRRWDWKYMPIHNADLNWTIVANSNTYDWWQFLTRINEYIGSTTNSEDKKLGYFFCKAKNEVIDAETFVGKVIFYLWNDVFKDYGFEGTLFLSASGSSLTFDQFYGTNPGELNEENIEQFLINLGLEPIEENNNNTEEEVSDDNGEFFVELPNLPRFRSNRSTDVVKFAINKLGPKRVVEELKKVKKLFQRNGCPVISNDLHDDIIAGSAYHYEELSDGYFFLAGIDNLNDLLTNIQTYVEPKMVFNCKQW